MEKICAESAVRASKEARSPTLEMLAPQLKLWSIDSATRAGKYWWKTGKHKRSLTKTSVSKQDFERHLGGCLVNPLTISAVTLLFDVVFFFSLKPKREKTWQFQSLNFYVEKKQSAHSLWLWQCMGFKYKL